MHRSDVKNIKELLHNRAQSPTKCSEFSTAMTTENEISFKPIGLIRTDFPEKRGVPRQPVYSN